MRLIVTGGGTGGHVYPALEVARAAAVEGAELRYWGSKRGQEGRACEIRGIEFKSFASVPLHSLRTPRGWKSLSALLRAAMRATKELRREGADVVFSTGGYSAAPVLYAARKLGVPYVLFESNSMPGRTTRMFVPKAKGMAYVFKSTRLGTGASGVRTGQPIRASLRAATTGRKPEENLVLVMGGSQGSAYLNERVPKTALDLPGVRFVHAAGKKHVGSLYQSVNKRGLADRYEVVAYLEEGDLLQLLNRVTLVIARSGGTLSELAAFRIPSVLVPLPNSADDHQRINAKEFVDLGAATLCEQHSGLMAVQVTEWLTHPEKRAAAEVALADWDIPDATDRIVKMLFGARS